VCCDSEELMKAFHETKLIKMVLYVFMLNMFSNIYSMETMAKQFMVYMSGARGEGRK
jgi:hypothetical protein